MSNQENINKTDIAWIKKTLTEIKEQTTRTNGRVTLLEQWKERIIGMTVVCSGVVTFIVNKLLQ